MPTKFWWQTKEGDHIVDTDAEVRILKLSLNKSNGRVSLDLSGR
jgi:hypothetical protein